MTGGWGIPELLRVAFTLPCTVFWVWMLVSAARNEKPGSTEQTVWILAILFTNVIGAVAYFAFRRPWLRREAPQ